MANSFTSPVRGIRRAKDWNEIYDIIKEMWEFCELLLFYWIDFNIFI
jgi:hypothetical protein